MNDVIPLGVTYEAMSLQCGRGGRDWRRKEGLLSGLRESRGSRSDDRFYFSSQSGSRTTSHPPSTRKIFLSLVGLI